MFPNGVFDSLPDPEIEYCILAGGRGKRMIPLTTRCPKPLISFGISARIIDYTIANCFHSHCSDLTFLTGFQSGMIRSYVQNRWGKSVNKSRCNMRFFSPGSDPGASFSGTADALLQWLLHHTNPPKYLVLLAADHIYQMDYRKMVAFHKRHGGLATIAATPCDRSAAHRFGIISSAENGFIERYLEKPEVLPDFVSDNQKPLASMGIYVLTTDRMLSYLLQNHSCNSYDLGRDIIPQVAADGNAWAFNISGAELASDYWRDVGELPAYWSSQMEMIQTLKQSSDAPQQHNPGFFSQEVARYVRYYESAELKIIDSIISCRAKIRSGIIEHSIVGDNCRFGGRVCIHQCVVLDNSEVEDGFDRENSIVSLAEKRNPRTVLQFCNNFAKKENPYEIFYY